MCFSTEASFGAAAVLGAMGTVAVRQTTQRQHLLFAAIPVFFALQQCSEGFVWLTLTNPDWAMAGRIPAYVFLVFALLVWPVWLPLSIWLLEKPGKRKKLLAALAVSGILFSLIVGFFLFSHSVSPEIKGHHIHYALGFKGGLFKGASLLYFIPTFLPPFFSSHRKVRILGLLLLVSYLFSKFYFADAVVSVWCFLAASISILVLLTLKDIREKETVLVQPG